MTQKESIMIRVAQIDEINTLNELIGLSARELSKTDYSPHEIDGAIQYIFGVDRELVEDKTYYVLEQEGTFIACGGWSRRKTLFGGDQCRVRENGFLNPKWILPRSELFLCIQGMRDKDLEKTFNLL